MILKNKRTNSSIFKEYLVIAFQLMFVSFSSNLMFFFNRFVLGQYSLHAMNAVVAAGTIFLIIQIFITNITSIISVFIGQSNGAEHYKSIGPFVWQMIWGALVFSLITSLIANWVGKTLIPSNYIEYGLPYFQWLMYFSFVFPINAAIISYYVGRGQIKIVAIIGVIGNLTNLILNFLFVFGFQPFLSSMGTKGAAFATICSHLLQIVILFVPFFSYYARSKYKTCSLKLNLNLLFKCLKTGFPNAFSGVLEIFGWFLLIILSTKLGESHLTSISIGYNFFILISFIVNGMEKGVILLVSNAIGRNDMIYVSKLLYSAFKLLVVFLMFLGIPLLFFSGYIPHFFLAKSKYDLQNLELIFHTKNILFFSWFFLLFNASSCLLSGVLKAAGDTKFIFYVNLFSMLIVTILPIYIFIYLYHYNHMFIWLFILLYNVTTFSCFYLRYHFGSWKEIRLFNSIM